MSVFTSRVTKTIDILHDPGQSITIRKLAPRHLEAAMKESQRKSLADLRAMGGPAFLKELESLRSDDVKTAVAADPLLLFDKITLMEKAITGWTYEEKLTAENFTDLDEETQEFLAREILRLAKPALFLTPEEAETARKNDSSGSIVH